MLLSLSRVGVVFEFSCYVSFSSLCIVTQIMNQLSVLVMLQKDIEKKWDSDFVDVSFDFFLVQEIAIRQFQQILLAGLSSDLFELKRFIWKLKRLSFLVSSYRNMIVVFKQGYCGLEIFLLHVLFVIFHCSSNNEPTECIGDVAESHKRKKKYCATLSKTWRLHFLQSLEWHGLGYLRKFSLVDNLKICSLFKWINEYVCCACIFEVFYSFIPNRNPG